MRAALSDAVRQGLMSNNPATLVKLSAAKRPRALVWTLDHCERWQEDVNGLRKSGRSLRKARDLVTTPSPVMVWRPDQLGQFLDSAAEDDLYALWHLSAFRGLRRGEACGLEWPDLDLDAARVSVVRQRISTRGVVYEDEPKSDAGIRTISLDAGTVTA